MRSMHWLDCDPVGGQTQGMLIPGQAPLRPQGRSPFPNLRPSPCYLNRDAARVASQSASYIATHLIPIARSGTPTSHSEACFRKSKNTSSSRWMLLAALLPLVAKGCRIGIVENLAAFSFLKMVCTGSSLVCKYLHEGAGKVWRATKRQVAALSQMSSFSTSQGAARLLSEDGETQKRPELALRGLKGSQSNLKEPSPINPYLCSTVLYSKSAFIQRFASLFPHQVQIPPPVLCITCGPTVRRGGIQASCDPPR